MADTVSQIQDTLQTGMSSAIDDLGGVTATQKIVLNNAASTLSADYASQIVNQVTTTANGQITTITASAIGPNNPIDLVSSNLNPNDVNSLLAPVVTSPLGESLTVNFVNDFKSLYQTLITPSQFSATDPNTIGESLTPSIGLLVNSGLGSALQSFSNQLFGTGSTVTPFFSSVSNLFSGGSDEALAKIDEQISSSVTTKALNDSRQFNVKSSDNQEKLVVTKSGFADPTATYPTKEYASRTETNKLATGDISGTVVQSKEKDRMIGAQLPNGNSWDQPQSPFKGEYPYNKVIQTESGHIIEMDDSQGAERLHIYHKSGTFIEIDANGSIVKRTKGSSYEIIDKNSYVAINGKTNVSINGACNIFVGSDANIEVDGDTNITCKNDITAQAGGRIDLSATEEINIRSKIVRIESDEHMHIYSDKRIDVNAQNLNVKVEQTVSQSATDKNTTLTGRLNINAVGDIDMDGAKVQVNSGASNAVEVAKAENAKIGLIGDRKAVSEVLITDPIAINYTDYSNTVAEDADDEQLAKENADQQILSGIATKGEISEPVVPGESESPKSIRSEVVPASNELLKATVLPENFQLSKHFTLGMLTNQAVVSKHKLQAQAGLTYGEIAYNLQALALNVLEPIKALYPNMLVTSCFRAVSKNPTSQHPKGLAVDIQIPGSSKKDYYDIAVKIAKVINYDQFLLEYKTTGTGLPWLHISFDSNKNRQQSLTFLNDRRYSDGFTQLA